MPSVRPRAYPVALVGIRLLVNFLCGVILGAAFVLSPFFPLGVAQAATITVIGGCTLPEAIQAANTDAAFSGCAAGSGADLILLPAPVNPVDYQAGFDVDGSNATPSITSQIVISSSTVGTVVERTDIDDARLFHVAATGDLTLVNLTLRNGQLGAFDGGAILNRGTLTLINSVLISNTALTGYGGGFINLGTATLTNTQILSNTASYGGGFYNLANAHLAESDLIANTAQNDGGGFYNDISATAILTNTQLLSNTAQNNGGGFYNYFSSITTLTSSALLSNTALTGSGGGFFNDNGATATLTNSVVRSNTAQNDGGGFYVYSGLTTLTNTQIISNLASSGGGFYNDTSATVNLTNIQILSNTAQNNGGGFFNNFNSTVNLTTTQIVANMAANYGGGFYNFDASLVNLANTQVLSNTAAVNGGGIFNDNGSVANLTDTQIVSNTALTGAGGGFNNFFATANLTNTQILSNTANSGGGIYSTDATTTLVQSCIVGNSDTAVVYDGGSVDAEFNWWGAPDGPSGVGLGSGDSVTSGVDFTPHLTTAVLGCPLHQAEIAFAKRVAPTGNLMPGQPVTYTLTLTNTGALTVHNLYVADVPPLGFILDTRTAAGSPHRTSGNTTIFTTTAPGQVATVTLRGQVDPTLNANLLLTNQGSITSPVLALMSASVASNVVVPSLRWSSATYAGNEGSGPFHATVLLTPPNPHAIVTVQAVITDSAAPLAVTAVQTLTFPVGSSSQTLVIQDVDDAQILTRTVQLGLATPAGASVGSPSRATMTFADNDVAGLTVDVRANMTQTTVGNTITYTIRITNTGDVTFTTVAASDSRLGGVAGLAGELAPNQSRTAILTDVAQAEDVGALVNTVTVTGTDALGGTVVVEDTVTVTVMPKPKTFLPVVVEQD